MSELDLGARMHHSLVSSKCILEGNQSGWIVFILNSMSHRSCLTDKGSRGYQTAYCVLFTVFVRISSDESSACKLSVTKYSVN